jgi:signal transduction histidine kinase
MKRPWQVWLVFVAGVVGAALAMAWLTRQALQADRLRRVAEADAELEQRVSLALWRMDTELAPIVAEEVIRSPSAYRAAFLTVPPPYVVLQFEAGSDGRWHSPQVPENHRPQQPAASDRTTEDISKRSAQFAELIAAIRIPELMAELPEAPLPSLAAAGSNLLAQTEAQTAEQRTQLQNQLQFFEGNRVESSKPNASPQLTKEAFGGKMSAASGKSIQASKAADFEERQQRYQSAAQQGLFNQRPQRASRQSDMPNSQIPDDDPFGVPAELVEQEQVGVSKPVWIGNRLLLARRVGWNGETVIQGCWLDWPQIKRRLLTEAADVLPDADLIAVKEDAPTDPGRMLAGLPVRLVVNEQAPIGTASSTLQWALWMGWGGVVLATAAAAALLHGVMSLSERRAAFVSSVTHELRTPLTTFRMYAEMLARGMVPDAARRQEYFNTLQREAERLTLLVENVLAYARLERGRKPQALERVTLDRLFDRVGPRLRNRAEQADMRCEIELAAGAADHEFTTDINIVEQILFNLVDNSAKYARDSSDRRIHVAANRDRERMVLTVRDHGPGIGARHWLKHTPAFSKSAQESADSAPGVGLGLALCRRLAQQLGGHLEIVAPHDGGALVILLLPAGESL